MTTAMDIDIAHQLPQEIAYPNPDPEHQPAEENINMHHDETAGNEVNILNMITDPDAFSDSDYVEEEEEEEEEADMERDGIALHDIKMGDALNDPEYESEEKDITILNMQCNADSTSSSDTNYDESEPETSSDEDEDEDEAQIDSEEPVALCGDMANMHNPPNHPGYQGFEHLRNVQKLRLERGRRELGPGVMVRSNASQAWEEELVTWSEGEDELGGERVEGGGWTEILRRGVEDL